MTITVLQSSINVPVTTSDQYQHGNTVTVTAGLRVSSSVNWDLSAKVSGDYTHGTYTIQANAIGIDVTNSIGNNVPEKMLSTADQIIVDAANKTKILAVDVPVLLDFHFRATGGTPFFNKPAGNYSTTLTYTITAD